MLDELLQAEPSDAAAGNSQLPETVQAPDVVLNMQSTNPHALATSTGHGQDAALGEAMQTHIMNTWPSDTLAGYEILDHGLASHLDQMTAFQGPLSTSSFSGFHAMAGLTLDGWQTAYPPHYLDASTPSYHIPKTPGSGVFSPRQPQQNLPRLIGSLSSLSIQEKYQLLGALELDLGSCQPSDLETPSSSSLSIIQSATPHSQGTSDDDPRPSLILAGDHFHQMESMRFQRWLHSRTVVQQPRPQMGGARGSTEVRLSQFSFWNALVSNATAIRFASQELGKEDGLSPFNVGLSNAHERSQPRAGHNTAVPRDLRPTDAQLKHPHHPYLDLIPFASFRQRAIDALAVNPPLIDWRQMCADINAAGMICWGGGGDANDSTNIGFQVPWDARSWEPKVWFLRKYWFLVGDWEDEMWTSARWWAAMRNENITYQ